MGDDRERDVRLAVEIEAHWPNYGEWVFDYMYPGYFCYYNERRGCSVFFTPDNNEDGALDIQVQDDEGSLLEDAVPYATVPYPEPLTASFMHDEAVKALVLVDLYYESLQ